MCSAGPVALPVQHLECCILPLLRTFAHIRSPFHARPRMTWSPFRKMGSSSSICTSAGRDSWARAFQFYSPLVARSTSSRSGTAPNRRAASVVDRCVMCSTMPGFRMRDLVLRRVPNNLAHRWRTSFFLQISTPVLSVTSCCPSACLPPRPTYLLRCMCSPLVLPFLHV